MNIPPVFELLPDIFGEFSAELTTPIAEEVNFLEGQLLAANLFPLPLEFKTGHSASRPPRGLLGQVIPLMSDEFIDSLQSAGVSNLQCFEARLVSTKDGSVWTNVKAVNIVGLADCADLSRSEFERVIGRPGSSGSALLDFVTLKVDVTRVKPPAFFRLGECPGTILMSHDVARTLLKVRSDDEWGITLVDRS